MAVRRAEAILRLIERAVRREMGDHHEAEDYIGQAVDKIWAKAINEDWSDRRIFAFAKWFGRAGRLNRMAKKFVSPHVKNYEGKDIDELFWDGLSFGATKAMQHINAEASEARKLLNLLPNHQRLALEIMCDGGTPIDVSVEMGLSIRDVLLLLKDARTNIHRV